MSTNPIDDASRAHPEAYYDEQGRLIKQCWCGKEGAFGYGVSLRQGKLGTYYCSEHWPDRPLPVNGRDNKAAAEAHQRRGRSGTGKTRCSKHNDATSNDRRASAKLKKSTRIVVVAERRTQ
jgi:hypothetical protein